MANRKYKVVVRESGSMIWYNENGEVATETCVHDFTKETGRVWYKDYPTNTWYTDIELKRLKNSCEENNIIIVNGKKYKLTALEN